MPRPNYRDFNLFKTLIRSEFATAVAATSGASAIRYSCQSAAPRIHESIDYMNCACSRAFVAFVLFYIGLNEFTRFAGLVAERGRPPDMYTLH